MTALAPTSARPRALTFGNVWLSVILVAVMFIYPFVFGKTLNFGISTLLFAGFAMSWNILGGWAGQTSLGHAALLGIGAYTMTLLATLLGFSPPGCTTNGMPLRTAASFKPQKCPCDINRTGRTISAVPSGMGRCAPCTYASPGCQ